MLWKTSKTHGGMGKTILRKNEKAFYCFFIFGLEISEAMYPKKYCCCNSVRLAAFIPPMKAPTNPYSFTASIAPLERLYPNPVRGTVAPAPAKSTNC